MKPNVCLSWLHFCIYVKEHTGGVWVFNNYASLRSATSRARRDEELRIAEEKKAHQRYVAELALGLVACWHLLRIIFDGFGRTV